MVHSTSLRPTESPIELSTLVASSARPLCASSSACLMAERSSGDVAALAAIAKAGNRRAGGAGEGAAVLEGRSGIVDGVKAGRVVSDPAWPAAPGGTEVVAASGRASGTGGRSAAAPLAGCFALSVLLPSSLCAPPSADVPARAAGLGAPTTGAGFAGFASGLRASWVLSDAAGFVPGFGAGFDATSGGAGAFGSSGAACGAAAQRAVAASAKQVSRTAF